MRNRQWCVGHPDSLFNGAASHAFTACQPHCLEANDLRSCSRDTILPADVKCSAACLLETLALGIYISFL
jgi:hypothetical protein